MNRPPTRALALAAVALVVLLAGAAWWLSGDGTAEPLAASGTVEATEADLGFPAAGTVERVAVEEGDAVRTGDTLAALDAAGPRGRLAAAAAAVAAARARLDELERGFRPQEIAQSRSAAEAAGARLEEAELNAERARALFAGEAISRRELDRAETALAGARAEAERARAQLDLVREGARQEQIAAQRAAVEQAEAILDQARSAFEDTTVVAPFPGVVTIRHRDPGETASPGAPVVTVMDPADRWVVIYVREDAIGRVSIGQPAIITSDTWPDREYDGRVSFIANEAEFTPANVQTEEERVKLVYAVKIRVTGDPSGDLKVGTPADVRILPGE